MIDLCLNLYLDEIIIDYDIFGQPCQISSIDQQIRWQPSEFYVADRVYRQLKEDLAVGKIDPDSLLLCLFPLFIDIPQNFSSDRPRGIEGIALPSTIPRTQHELAQLQERFHFMLNKKQALEIGLCRQRRRIYDDLFDELIRVVTLECAERGLLLARVKNEHVRWINIYEELYTSGMAYALRQYLYKTDLKSYYNQKIEQIECDCKQLRQEIEQESRRSERANRLLLNRDLDEEEGGQSDQQRQAKKHVQILQSANEILRRDLSNTLNNILSSTIFLGEPIEYDRGDEENT